MSDSPLRMVLNVGAGRPDAGRLHPCFSPRAWREIRLDIDPDARPDVVGSVLDLRQHFDEATFDAIWSSHNLEHLYDHEVPVALGEFRRVLKPSGFAIITCPDIESVAQAVLAHGMDWVAYQAPIGPITVHDMMFGHGGSVATGNVFMAHRTAFTCDRLGSLAVAAGFREVRVGRGLAYDLWALLPMPSCDMQILRREVENSNLIFLFDEVETVNQSARRP